ncbi:transmembrane protein, putative [Medicago truncatula]|uniref:Transmembrane protein, putative n=1 Tax=Medicago truncatula TaxID=3880 RepID=A0A072VNI2_MEDTR|nr:transmembrane protein, putative [Medicago truncatula]
MVLISVVEAVIVFILWMVAISTAVVQRWDHFTYQMKAVGNAICNDLVQMKAVGNAICNDLVQMKAVGNAICNDLVLHMKAARKDDEATRDIEANNFNLWIVEEAMYTIMQVLYPAVRRQVVNIPSFMGERTLRLAAKKASGGHVDEEDEVQRQKPSVFVEPLFWRILLASKQTYHAADMFLQ